MQAIIIDIEFPPSDSFSSRVNLESLYGIKFSYLLRLLMQFPNANKLLLIFYPSFCLSPVLLAIAALSLPAKSQNTSLPSIT